MWGFEAVANADLVDNIKVQENLGEYVKEILEQEKESDKGPIKSILLECTQMPHYAAAIRQSTGLPVFDVVTCVNFFASSLCRPERVKRWCKKVWPWQAMPHRCRAPKERIDR